MPTKKPAPPLHPNRARAIAAVKEFRAIVEREGWTHEEAATKSRFGISTVSRWMRSEHAPRAITMIEALEKFVRKHRQPETQKEA